MGKCDHKEGLAAIHLPTRKPVFRYANGVEVYGWTSRTDGYSQPTSCLPSSPLIAVLLVDWVVTIVAMPGRSLIMAARAGVVPKEWKLEENLMIRWMLTALVIAVAQASPTSAQVDLKVVAARARVRYGDVPRQVLAFYYPWYSAETWRDVDVTKHTISNVAHFPVAGPYESHAPKLIARHCAWARQAGIDGWIVSWWGHGTPTDRC